MAAASPRYLLNMTTTKRSSLRSLAVLIVVVLGVAVIGIVVSAIAARVTPSVDGPRDAFVRKMEALRDVELVSDDTCYKGRLFREDPSCIFLVTAVDGLSPLEKSKLMDLISTGLKDAVESGVILNAEVRFGSASVAVSPNSSLNTARLNLAEDLVGETDVDRAAVLWNWDGRQTIYDSNNRELLVLVESEDSTRLGDLADGVRPIVEAVFPDANIRASLLVPGRTNHFQDWLGPAPE